MYENILFDLYGTLIDIRTDEEMPELWKKIAAYYSERGAKYTADEIQEEYVRLVAEEKKRVAKAYPEYKVIDIPIENVFAKLYTLKNVDVQKKGQDFVNDTAAYFRKSSTLFIELYDGVIELMEYLKSNKKHVYLLSNAQHTFTMNEIKELGLSDYFDDIFISSDYCVSKPDTHFYEKPLGKYNMDKSKTIMVGNDYISDMKGAHDAGIDGLYIHQEISPDIEGEVIAKWKIMDGDVHKIKEYLS